EDFGGINAFEEDEALVRFGNAAQEIGEVVENGSGKVWGDGEGERGALGGFATTVGDGAVEHTVESLVGQEAGGVHGRVKRNQGGENLGRLLLRTVVEDGSKDDRTFF